MDWTGIIFLISGWVVQIVYIIHLELKKRGKKMDFFLLFALGISSGFVLMKMKNAGFKNASQPLNDSNDTQRPHPLSKKLTAQTRSFYHGTKMDIALDIYETHLWLVGKSEPRGVYLGKTFSVAKGYCGKDGGIVVVSVSPAIELKKKYEDAFYYPLSHEKAFENYYRVEGLVPIGVLTPDGTRIR